MNNLTLEVSVKELPFIQELVSIMQEQAALIAELAAALGGHVDFNHWDYRDEAEGLSRRLGKLLKLDTPATPA